MKLKLLEEQHLRKFGKINENIILETGIHFQDIHSIAGEKDEANLNSSDVVIKKEREKKYNTDEVFDEIFVEPEIKFEEKSLSDGFKEETEEEEEVEKFLKLQEMDDEDIRNGIATNLLKNLNEESQKCIKSMSLIRNTVWCENINHEELTLSCIKCSKSFTSETAFFDHQKIHSNDLFECPDPECNKIFDRSISLKIHMAFHGALKRHKCKICKKSFTRKSSLKDHALSHSGEKPYQCDICKKFYRSKRSLVSHFRYHFKNKIYECPVCRKSFFQPSGLSEHLRMHKKAKEYKCKICAKCFGYESSLKRHIKSHFGATLYHCDECDKSFKQNSSLSYHKRTKHLGIKPYKCEDCDKDFSRAWSLRNHMNVHRIFQIPNTIEIITTKKKIDSNSVS